jgi:excinuclease ABC subunit C
VVTQTLKEMGLGKVAAVGLAKAGEQDGRPVRDRLFLPGRKNPLLPPANAPGWLLLLRLRDETHRFAITYHRKRARKEMLASVLDAAPGIGPVRKRRLLEHFPNLEAIKAANSAQLAALPGFNQKVAESLSEWLAGAGQGA